MDGLTGHTLRFAGVTLTLSWLAVGCARAAPQGDEPGALAPAESSTVNAGQRAPGSIAKTAATSGLEPARAGWATLAGHITLKGEVPALAPLVTQGDEKVRDAAHCAAHQVESLVVDVQSKGIRNVFVYLRRKPERIHHERLESLPKVAEFDQKGCRLLPHALAMHLDRTLLIINSDAVPHGTRVQGGIAGGTRLNLPGGEPDRHTFSRARPVPIPVTCDFHPWMRAWILVQDHPYYAVTDDQGRFAIENLPAGVELEFRVWHEATGYVDSADGSITRGALRATLEADATTTRNIEVDVSSFDLS